MTAPSSQDKIDQLVHEVNELRADVAHLRKQAVDVSRIEADLIALRHDYEHVLEPWIENFRKNVISVTTGINDNLKHLSNDCYRVIPVINEHIDVALNGLIKHDERITNLAIAVARLGNVLGISTNVP